MVGRFGYEYSEEPVFQGWTPMEQDLLQWDSSACPICPFDMLLVEVVGGTLVWFRAGHLVCCFWEILGNALVQAMVSCCLCPVQVNLVSATK